MHASADNQRRKYREPANGRQRRWKPEGIGQQAGEQRPDGIARVAPEAEDAHATRPLRRRGVFGHGGQKCGIDQRRARAEQRRQQQKHRVR
ncbi:hypothetical protein SAMN00120144_0238 [Hymenobacter roseosalivarius DSM 11622]|uniref:Uncharacterized protein n=1 Tax=Hymenobacter roseosalivarius DSM 11622 TaxID=645990 RepID=A0A1W1W218_9BACT|nr:hypothetical protein SAMN00120144_0238 [Hymenobacter roseosalivarius DSM 11622]